MDNQALCAWEANIQKLESLIERIDEMNAETERPEESLGGVVNSMNAAGLLLLSGGINDWEV